MCKPQIIALVGHCVPSEFPIIVLILCTSLQKKCNLSQDKKKDYAGIKISKEALDEEASQRAQKKELRYIWFDLVDSKLNVFVKEQANDLWKARLILLKVQD